MNDVKELKYLSSNVLKGIIDTLMNTVFHQNCLVDKNNSLRIERCLYCIKICGVDELTIG